MDSATFNHVLEAQLDRSTSVLGGKAAEYATDDDRLHNFKVAANLQGISLEKALSGMMAKHTVSVYDMCNSGKNYPMALWDEKITDHINYLLLLRAVVQEDADTYSDASEGFNVNQYTTDETEIEAMRQQLTGKTA